MAQLLELVGRELRGELGLQLLDRRPVVLEGGLDRPAAPDGDRAEVVADLVPHDLLVAALGRQRTLLLLRDDGVPPGPDPGERLRVRVEIAANEDLPAVLAGQVRIVREDLGASRLAAAEGREEIGRASCRERV